jgi:hypothetical protein
LQLYENQLKIQSRIKKKSTGGTFCARTHRGRILGILMELMSIINAGTGILTSEFYHGFLFGLSRKIKTAQLYKE